MDRATVQGVRNALADGLIVPGLRKLGGRWLVPVGPLTEALDGLAQPDASRQPVAHSVRHTVIINPTLNKHRGRVPDAVRLGKIQQWGGEVLKALDEIERLRNVAAAEHEVAILKDLLPAAPRGPEKPPF
jgi:hypothetical protein